MYDNMQPCGLFLSSQNQQKKKLVKNLKSFQEVIAFSDATIYSNNKYTLINYKGLALSESEIQNSFRQLHIFFNQGIQNKLARLFIVVKFDRVGNMINCAKHLFIKFKNYDKITTLIITDWDKSQNRSQDLYILKNEFFNYFSITTNFIICERSIDYSKQIIQSCDQQSNLSLKLNNQQLNLIPKGINTELYENMQKMFKPDYQLQQNSQQTSQNKEHIQQVPESIQMKNPQQAQQRDQSTQCEQESLCIKISTQNQQNTVYQRDTNERQTQTDLIDDEQQIPPIQKTEVKANKLNNQSELQNNQCKSPQKQKLQQQQPQINNKKTEQQIPQAANGSYKKQELNKYQKQNNQQKKK